jgi:putative endonuclease
MRATQALGRHGEDLAAAYLTTQGFVLLERNWQCSTGEIDIVARDAETLVICEVKTRRGLVFGAPLEAVTPGKASRLQRLAAEYRRQRDAPPGPVRIDLVGVLVPRSGAPSVEHLRGVA